MAAAQFFFAALRHCLLTACIVFFNLGRLVHALLRPRAALASENLFLRKQLALFQERSVKPRRTEDSTRWLMATVSRLFDWWTALAVVKPDTFVRWHRRGFRLFWRWKSKSPERLLCRRTSSDGSVRWRVTIRVGVRNGSLTS